MIFTFLIFFGYFIYFQSCLNESRILYSNGRYYDAYNRIDKLIYLGGSNDFDQISFAYEIGNHYETYNNLAQKNTEESFYNLIKGLESCILNQSNVKNNSQKVLIEQYKLKYYIGLNKDFNISEEYANSILYLNFAEQKKVLENLNLKEVKD